MLKGLRAKQARMHACGKACGRGTTTNLSDTGNNVNNSYKPIMLKIQSFFGITADLRVSKHNIDKTYWIIEVTSLNKLNFLIQYLDIYPLLTFSIKTK